MSSGEVKDDAGNQAAQPYHEKEPLINRPRKHVVFRVPAEAEVRAARLRETRYRPLCV
jgi:hypothetical protein